MLSKMLCCNVLGTTKKLFRILFALIRCNEPNLVETFYDTRTFPVRFGNGVEITNVNERILNHEEFAVTVRSVLQINIYDLSLSMRGFLTMRSLS